MKIDLAAEAASTVQGQAVSIGPAVVAASATWTARLRTDHVAIFQVSASRGFKIAALIALGAVALAAAIALVVAVVSAAAVAVALADSVAVDFAAALAGSGEDVKN